MKITIELNDAEAAILKTLAIAEKRTVKAQAEWVLGRQLQEIEEKRQDIEGERKTEAILLAKGRPHFNTVPLEIQPTCCPTPAPEESQPLA